MRRFVVLLVLAGVLAGSGLVTAIDYTSYSGFVTSEEPVLPKQEVHPSLWFDTSEIKALVDKRNGDAYAAKLWDWVWQDIQAFKEDPLPKIPLDLGKDVSRYYGTISRAAKYLAFAWITTGDTAARDKAIEALLRAYDGPIFQLDRTVSSSVVDEIYAATWLQNYATAYDWVANALTPEQSKAIRPRLIKEAKLTYDKLEIWGPRPHNHLSKPAWGLGTLALTFSSESEAAEWLRKALYEANRNTRYFFSADGIYREGSHYLFYSSVNFLPFLYHYRNVSGVNNFPVYQPAFEWMLYVRNGRGWLPNLEDAYIKPTPLHMVAKEYMNVVSPLNPAVKLGNLFQWSFQKSDVGAWWNPPFTMGDSAAYRINANSYSGASIDDTWNLDEYLAYDPTIKPVAPTASGTIFLDRGGQTIFRNNWTYKDPTHRYLLFHGVAEADNHFHYDHLSFIIQACDQMMASDCGYSTGSYSDAIRKNWFMIAPAHNVITADGNEPMDAAENVTPVSRYNLDTQVFDFQQKEAPFYKIGGILKRAIGFPGQDYFVVADSIAGKAPATYELYLHGGRARMTGAGNHRLWTYREDAYGRAAKMAAWILPANASFLDEEGDVTYIKGDSVLFPYVKATVKATNTLFMQVLIPLRPEEPIPAVTDLSSGGLIGAKVIKGEATDTFLLQAQSQTGQAASLTATATFAWAREQAGSLRAWMVREAIEASYGGALLFRASAPVTAVADLNQANKMILSIAANQTACVLRLPAPGGAKVSRVLFKGAEQKVTVVDGLLEMAIPGPGELVIELAR